MKKNLMKKAILTIILILTINVATATEPVIYGNGSYQCEAYLETIKKELLSSEQKFTTWAQGYISGYNVASARRGHKQKAIDLETLELNILANCIRYRDTPFVQIVDDIARGVGHQIPPW